MKTERKLFNNGHVRESWPPEAEFIEKEDMGEGRKKRKREGDRDM